MSLEGTKVGADGKRHPAGDEPTNAADYRRKPVNVFGDIEAGQTAVWDPGAGKFLPAPAGLSDEQLAALASDQELADAIAGISGGGGVTVEAENVEVAPDVTTLNFVGATVTDAGFGQANIEFAGGGGSFATRADIEGWGGVPGPGTHTVDLGSPGNFGFGFMHADTAESTVIMKADSQYGDGVFGGVVADGGGTAAIKADSTYGSLAFGSAYASGAAAAATIYSFDNGALAHGRALSYGGVSYIHAEEVGATAQGFTYSLTPGGQARIRAMGRGSFVTGRATNDAGQGANTLPCVGEIYASGFGAVAMGDAYGVAAGFKSQIIATNNGSVAFGRAMGRNSSVTSASIIESDGYGSFAFGNATAYGAVAGRIRSTSYGSFAGGHAYGADIGAYGRGSFAFGRTYNGGDSIWANNDNCVQFFPGANSQSQSLQVGTTIRIKGTTGQPSSNLHDGDIWVDSSGNIMIRSGGATRNLSNVAI